MCKCLQSTVIGVAGLRGAIKWFQLECILEVSSKCTPNCQHTTQKKNSRNKSSLVCFASLNAHKDSVNGSWSIFNGLCKIVPRFCFRTSAFVNKCITRGSECTCVDCCGHNAVCISIRIVYLSVNIYMEGRALVLAIFNKH